MLAEPVLFGYILLNRNIVNALGMVMATRQVSAFNSHWSYTKALGGIAGILDSNLI